tara:strand:+ start:2854 stop:3936 length:1083 start_codon:yes stop_codon:yes gene_type:complete
MPSIENRVIIACAGSGKTTRLVKDALADPDKRIGIITFTNNSAREISKRFDELNSGVPQNTKVMTWLGFLLRECARPYQRSMFDTKRIDSLMFMDKISAKYSKEARAHHYFANPELIYSDKIAKFTIKCEENSSKAVTTRLGQIFTDLYFDEFQDLAGWDFNVIEMLLQSAVRVTLVGDPRQHVYSTHQSRKNKKYLGANVLELVRKWEKKKLCVLELMNNTYRCNGMICEFANKLWPGMEVMESLRNNATEHDGVFLVSTNNVEQYIRQLKPQVLRHDKRSNAYGSNALNFGQSKGLQFDHILISPTASIKKYLADGNVDHVKKSREKLYVAITRARHSIAFVYDDTSPIIPRRWQQAD